MDTETPTEPKPNDDGPDHRVAGTAAADHNPRAIPTAPRFASCLTTSSRGWSPSVARLDLGAGAPRRGPRLSGSLTHGLSTSRFAAS